MTRPLARLFPARRPIRTAEQAMAVAVAQTGALMDEPRQFHPTHTHRCAEKGCTARVGCAARRCRECEDPHCEMDHSEVFLCEEHYPMSPCDWCGGREGVLIEHDGDQMHPACVAEDVQAQAARREC